MNRYLIIAGGEMDVSPPTDGIARIICADGGYAHAKRFGIKPDIIVGDFDSYDYHDLPNVEIITAPTHKDDTDTLMAVKTALEEGADSIILVGALGGRFDHTYANIQTLAYALKKGVHMEISDGKNIIMLLKPGGHKIKRGGKYFSIFAFTEKLDIKKLSGTAYPLECAVLTNSYPLGVSNEFTEECAEIEISDGIALVTLFIQ